MKQYIWGIGVLVMLALLALWPVSRGVWQRSINYSATRTGISARKFTDGIKTIVKLSSLDKELKEAEEENSLLQAKIANLESLKIENETLRKEIGLQDSGVTSKNSIVARVIGRSPSNFLQILSLDRGSDDGVAIGQTVTANGYLVGKIKSLTPHTSEADIISSGQLMLPVLLQGSRGTGIIRGGLEGLIIEEIPLDADVKEGESVVTQDLEGIVISGVPIGTIRSVDKHKGDIFQRAIAESPLDFSRLDIVMIISS